MHPWSYQKWLFTARWLQWRSFHAVGQCCVSMEKFGTIQIKIWSERDSNVSEHLARDSQTVIDVTWYKPDSRNGLTADVVQVPIHTQNLERVPVVH